VLAGTNALLRLGAVPVTSPGDVLELLGLLPEQRPKPRVDGAAATVLEALPATMDELVQRTGLAAGPIAAALAELELSSLVVEGEGVFRAA